MSIKTLKIITALVLASSLVFALQHMMRDSRIYTDNIVIPYDYIGAVRVYFDVPTAPVATIEPRTKERLVIVEPDGYAVTATKRDNARGFQVSTRTALGASSEIKWDQADTGEYYFTKYAYGSINLTDWDYKSINRVSAHKSVAFIDFLVCRKGSEDEKRCREIDDFDRTKKFETVNESIIHFYKAIPK